MPRLQEKGTIDLYLSRPIGRVPLLLSRYAGGLLLAAANVAYMIGAIWLIVAWKTRVFHPRFLLSGVVILFTIATLMAFAFLIGVVTSSTAVSLMGTYAVFFFAAILALHTTRSRRPSRPSSRRASSRASTGSCPRPPSSARPRSRSSPDPRRRNASRDVNPLAVFGSTALFGVAVARPGLVALFQKGLLTMKRSGSGFASRLASARGGLSSCSRATDARAVRRTEDPLALVPADAATVAVMRWSELRQTPLGARVFRRPRPHLGRRRRARCFSRRRDSRRARTSTR